MFTKEKEKRRIGEEGEHTEFKFLFTALLNHNDSWFPSSPWNDKSSFIIKMIKSFINVALDNDGGSAEEKQSF